MWVGSGYICLSAASLMVFHSRNAEPLGLANVGIVQFNLCQDSDAG